MTQGLILRAVQNDAEWHRANDLMAKAHRRDYYSILQWMETVGRNYPGFRREHTRIALLHGEIAGALRITTDTIRIGEARLKMGGLGWVTTAGTHRHKGIARELMLHTMQYLREQRYHVAMLFGIPNFYHRFGFATTLAEYSVALDLASTAPAGHNGALRVRPAKPSDLPAIAKMHSLHDGDTVCSLIRSVAHFTNRWDQWKNATVLTDQSGKLRACFLAETVPNELDIKEVALAAPEVCPSLLHACAECARAQHLARLRFHAPPAHPIARFLLQFRSTHEMRITHNEGGMMAFVNLEEALESMIPEWEHLLDGSAVRNDRIEITFVVDAKPLRLRAHRGAISIAPASGQNKLSLTAAELMHLVTGYSYVEDLLERKRRILSAAARNFLHTIFPKRTPFVWPLDRF